MRREDEGEGEGDGDGDGDGDGEGIEIEEHLPCLIVLQRHGLQGGEALPAILDGEEQGVRLQRTEVPEQVAS